MARRGFGAPHASTPAERVMYHVSVDLSTRCWNWLGCISAGGYGLVAPPGQTNRYAHRYSYEVFVGPIPNGLQIDHLCRNRACVNPEHLEAVTPSVNVRRGESPGAKALRRTECLKGHPYAEFGRMYRGRRICRECNRIRSREWQAEARERRAATWAKYLGETA